jgi:hypothetical protein
MRTYTAVHVGSGPTHPDRRAPVLLCLGLALAPMDGPAFPADGTDRHHNRMMADDEARWAASMPACCSGETCAGIWP